MDVTLKEEHLKHCMRFGIWVTQTTATLHSNLCVLSTTTHGTPLISSPTPKLEQHNK